ncbi:MAG: phenylalanine--tRNA ligase subunit beta, partial [Oscillospiraceae bacterium]|nr:phenylalanine--tRNA ligase subunit beta [Oscillospiraceae bacterium]
PSKFPGMEVDLSLLVEKSRPYSDIAGAIGGYSAENSNLAGVSLVDIYEHESLGGDKVVTVRLAFSSAERTLSSAEVQEETALIIAALEDKGVMLKK